MGFMKTFFKKTIVSKKTVALLAAFLMVLQTAALPVFGAEYTVIERHIRVLGGSTIGKVIIIDDITMIDISSLAFYISGSPISNNGIRKGDHEFTVDVGTATAYVDGKQVTMPVKSFAYNGGVYVPLSFAVKSLGLMLYWREQSQTIYIQKPEYYQAAYELIQKSAEAVKGKKGVTTSYVTYTNLSSDQPDRYFVESTGVMTTDMENNTAKDQYTQTLYNGYYSSVEHKPVQIYVSKDPLDRLDSLCYVTANGIYYLNEKGGYDKEPVPPENVSTMDMASKSVLTDLDLFLYSATISQEYTGESFSKDHMVTVLKAETDIGILLKVGFNIYMPAESQTLKWTQTYQTIRYDPKTFLPQDMNLRLRASFQYGEDASQLINLDYDHTYEFDYEKEVQVILPEGVN